MRHLVFFINTADLFLSHRQHLAQRALQMGFKVTVLCPHGPRFTELEALGYRCVPLDLSRKGTNPFTELLTVIRLVRVLNDLQPDIVHNFTIKCVFYGTIAARLVHVPRIINTVTGRGHVFIDSGLIARAVRVLLSILYPLVFSHRSVRFVFQNEDDRHLYVHRGWISPEHALVIAGTGVDLLQFSPRDHESAFPAKILFAGRYLKEKGLRELITACDRLYERKLNFELLICGRLDPGNPSGFSAEEWESLINRPYIRNLGFRQKMAEVYPLAHIACLPSYAEGLPLTLVEAAACGLPLVATDVPGCRDVVKDGVNGWLVPIKDSEALAQALIKLIESPELRLKFGAAARRIAQTRYDRALVVEQGLVLYTDV